MKRNRKKISALYFTIFFLLFPAFLTPVDAATGLDWLATRQNINGGFGATPSSLATSVQSTAEVIETYQALGEQSQAPYGPALAFLNNDTPATADIPSVPSFFPKTMT